ncbi:MAG: DivIVA domain-containing protein [bacterium]|jgi:cell division initiation protein|nr:DivIVA domain-containing protein [bacterium]
MRITPLDVRKQEFGKSMRGFDCDEVRAFLNTLADEYEAVLVDNKQIRERTLDLEDKLGEYQRLEKNLRDTLMTAERLTQESRESAAREGELIIRDAEMKARGVLEECRLRTEELRREITGLRKEKETYLARFRSLAEAQIQFIDTHRSDFEDLDRRLTDIVDTVVTRTGPSAPAAQQPWNNPYVQAPAGPAAAYAPPSVPTASGPVAAAPVQAAQAPAAHATFAPPSANDIWRDYIPGRTAQGNAAPAAPQFHQPAPAQAQSQAYGQSTQTAATLNPAPAYEPEEDLNGVIAHTLAEVGDPVHGPEPRPGAPEAWRPEPVVTEVTNI